MAWRAHRSALLDRFAAWAHVVMPFRRTRTIAVVALGSATAPKRGMSPDLLSLETLLLGRVEIDKLTLGERA